MEFGMPVLRQVVHLVAPHCLQSMLGVGVSPTQAVK